MEDGLQQAHDVVVIGSGAAGLTAALALAEHARVLVLAKGSLTGGSTAWAQGGIAAVLEDVWRYCEKNGIAGRTVTVKIKYADFQIVTRSRTLLEPPADKAALERVSVELVRSIFPLEKKVRLLGVSLHNLHRRDEASVPPQLTLGLL